MGGAGVRLTSERRFLVGEGCMICRITYGNSRCVGGLSLCGVSGRSLGYGTSSIRRSISLVRVRGISYTVKHPDGQVAADFEERVTVCMIRGGS